MTVKPLQSSDDLVKGRSSSLIPPEPVVNIFGTVNGNSDQEGIVMEKGSEIFLFRLFPILRAENLAVNQAALPLKGGLTKC